MNNMIGLFIYKTVNLNMGNYMDAFYDNKPEKPQEKVIFEGTVMELITRKSTNNDNPNGLYIKVNPTNDNGIFSFIDFSGKKSNKPIHLILNTTNPNYKSINDVIKKDVKYKFTILQRQLYPILVDIEKC